MVKMLWLVGIGGAIGCIARFLASQYTQRLFVASGFPYATMFVNVLGCLIIGLVYGLSQRFNWLTPEWRIFLTTGFCGGFTTFSTFSFESVTLIQDYEFIYAALNVAVSVIVGFAATYLGMSITKII